MAATLGESFPEEYREEFVNRTIGVKGIVKVHVPSFNAPYDKWIVIIAQSSCGKFYGCVPINTDEELFKDHASIKKEDHDFLKYDSWIHCKEIVEFSVDELNEKIRNEPKREFGQISDEKHIQIQNIIRNSRRITPKIKSKFGLR